MMKIFKKILFLLFSILLLISLFFLVDLTNIDNSYVNRSLIEIDRKNLNSRHSFKISTYLRYYYLNAYKLVNNKSYSERWEIEDQSIRSNYPDKKIIKTIEVAFKEVADANATDVNNELHLETSTPFARDQFLLETGSYLLTEDSTTELGLDNIIASVKIVPEGGANTYITPGDDFDANTTITFYSPPVDYNDATGTYE